MSRSSSPRYFGQYIPHDCLWLTNKQGHRLRLCHWLSRSKKSRATIIFCHGRTEFIEKYESFFAELNEEGADVIAFDFTGYGLSDGREGGYLSPDNFEVLVDDLARVEAWTRWMKGPSQPLHCIAHSMGGAVLLHRLIDGSKVDGAVFLSPMWKICLNYPRWMVFAVTGLLKQVNKHWVMRRPKRLGDAGFSYETDSCANDPIFWQTYHRMLADYPALLDQGATAQWIYSALRELYKLEASPMPQQPALCVLSGEDTVVDNKTVYAWKKRWSQLHVVEIADARHELLTSAGKQRAELLDHIRHYLGLEKILNKVA